MPKANIINEDGSQDPTADSGEAPVEDTPTDPNAEESTGTETPPPADTDTGVVYDEGEDAAQDPVLPVNPGEEDGVFVEDQRGDLDSPEEFDDGVPLEELDPNEELWEGGPTVEQALKWKKKYGKLFITSLDYDDHILWRPILRNEYKNHVRHIEKMTSSGKVSQLEANLLNEELLAKTCMLWPEYDPAQENLAGVPSIISQEIMEASGFVALQVRQL